MLEIESTKTYANGVWWCNLWEEIRIRWDREGGVLMLSVPLKQKGPKQAGLLFLTIWCPPPHHGTARRSSETWSRYNRHVPGLPNVQNYELITAILQELASRRKSMRILILWRLHSVALKQMNPHGSHGSSLRGDSHLDDLRWGPSSSQYLDCGSEETEAELPAKLCADSRATGTGGKCVGVSG